MLSGKFFCDLYLDLYTVEHKFPRSFRALHKMCGLIAAANRSGATGVTRCKPANALQETTATQQKQTLEPAAIVQARYQIKTSEICDITLI